MHDGQVIVRRKRYEWIDYPTEPVMSDEGETIWTPDADFAGFRVRVYANTVMEEVRHELVLWKQMTAEEISEWDYLTEFADRIVAWNYAAETVDGEVAPVPPPCEDPHSFYLLPPAVMYWVVGTMRTAHFPKAPEATPPIPLPSPGTTDTSTPTKTSRAAKRRAA